eukprot:scaffold33679_cov57-Attheya_sp.AAC.1
MGCTESIKHDEGQNSFEHLQRRNDKNDNVEHQPEDRAIDNSSFWVKVWIPGSQETLELPMVEPTDTIQALKNQINRQKGYPEENQSLWLGKRELRHNYHTVSDYQINTHSLLELRLVKAAGQGENEIKMYIKTLDGSVFEWCADDESTTILALKHSLQRLVLVPVERQTLLYRSKELLDFQTLASYRIPDEARLFLIQRDADTEPLNITTVMDVTTTSSNNSSNRSGCPTIPKPEYRGITLRQLKELIVHIVFYCRIDKWKSTDPSQHAKLLKPEEVTLYDVVQYLVKPLTEKRRCSYVELIADMPQKPLWFVSHWWGESVFQFVSCIERHAYDRGLGDDATYWVCAYAIAQHGDISDTLGKDPRDSPFYKAMALSKGTISILDRESDAALAFGAPLRYPLQFATSLNKKIML